MSDAAVPTIVSTGVKQPQQHQQQQQLQVASTKKWLSGTWTARYPDIVHSKTWLVEAAKARKTFPAVMGRRKKRRLSVELRRKGQPRFSEDLEAGPSDWGGEAVEEGDMIVLRVLKRMKDTGSVFKGSIQAASSASSAGSSDSVSSIGFRAVDNDHIDMAKILEDQWIESLVVPVARLKVAKIEKNKCSVVIGRGVSKYDYGFSFQNEEEAIYFEQFLAGIQNAMRSISTETIQNILPLKESVEIPTTILFEIVSATSLQLGNGGAADPYAVAFFGGEEIHRTSVISKTLDPIWTMKTQSLFTFTFFPEDLDSSEFIIEVRDSSSQGDVKLGQVLIPNDVLLRGNGKRIELGLKYILNRLEPVEGNLVVRFKPASENEINFVNHVAKNKKPALVDNYIAPRQAQGPASVVTKKMFPEGKKQIAKPLRNGEERWMTPEELDLCAREESELWIDAGSGDLGTLYVEVIGCDNLPNIDRGFPNEKTDCFITTVFEDSIISTDVIMKCNSPRFLPWTRRAFQFHIKRAMSPLFIGVFDLDNRMQFGHEYIGRVVLHPSKFDANTAYNLTYDIYDSHQTKKRSTRGTITLRIRVDWKQPKGYFFDNLSRPDKFEINIENRKEFRYALDVVKGRPDIEKYSVQTLVAYGQELRAYSRALINAKNALKSIILWRSHYQLGSCRFYIPLNSMILFIMGILVCEWPRLLISFFFAVIAWVMLAQSSYQQKRPSPWNKNRGYTEILMSFLFGRKQRVTIDPYQNHQEDEDFISDLNNQKKALGQEIEDIVDAVMNDMKELEKSKATEMKANMQAQLFSSPSMNPLESHLYPVQLKTGEIVNKIRFVNGILTWSYGSISFWMTTAAIILSVLTASMQGVVLQWTARVIVWTFLGPWMKLVDIFYFQRLEQMTSSEKEVLSKEKVKRKLKNDKSGGRRKEEDAMQSKAMKQFLFGDYILHVPCWTKPERYESSPLPQSSAFPFDVKSLRTVRKKKLMGQSITSNTIIPANYSDFVRKKESSKGRSILYPPSFPKNPFKALQNKETQSLISNSQNETNGKGYGALGRMSKIGRTLLK